MRRHLAAEPLLAGQVLLCALAFVSRGDETIFEIAGQEGRAHSLGKLFELHYHDPVLKGTATLWDQWLASATLWRETDPPDASRAMREHWRHRLLSRPINAEGFVDTCQHPGGAHSEGWPFPIWQQAIGVGFHFSYAGNGYMSQFGTPVVASTEGWTLEGCTVSAIDAGNGLTLKLEQPGATLATPLFDVVPFVSPFVCIEWSADGLLPSDRPSLEGFDQEDLGAAPARETEFSPLRADQGFRRTTVPLPKPSSGAHWRRLRIRFGNSGPATVTIRAIHTAIDSRHNINNSSLVLGALDYADATADLPFLREMLPSLRKVTDYAINEFHVRDHGCVRTTWVGHDGRTGLARDADGKRVLLRGTGIGNNYWDLLPFGGRDMLATMYLYQAIRRLAAVEALVERHPEWNLPGRIDSGSAAELNALADRMLATSQQMFWHGQNQRFVACVDEDGLSHDFGFTFVNFEAITHGIASDRQARAIFDWIDGRRSVLGDTSHGADIYHFRFAPRATTRRNVEWYMFAWADPDSIPFGGQVQDGGAVLGFSYHDVMARLATLGPASASERIMAIADWFTEVQEAGGYRKYYADPARGTLQGGGTAGGLGLDAEFVESVMLPVALVHGFAGLTPTLEGLVCRPKLPSDWPSFQLHGYQVHGHVLDFEFTPGVMRVTRRRAGPRELALFLPPSTARVESPDGTIELPAASTPFRWSRGGPNHIDVHWGSR